METKHPEASGGAVVPLFLIFNVLSLLYFVLDVKITVELSIYIASSIFIITWIFFFNKRKLHKYQSKWNNENIKKKRIKGILIILYILLTITSLGLALSKT